jgi:hypothetical protein
VQGPVERRLQRVGRLHQVERPAGAVRQPRPLGPRRRRSTADQQAGPARLVALEPGQGLGGIGRRGDGDGVCDGPQGCRNGLFQARLHGDQRRDGAEHTGHAAVQQRSGAVAGQRQRQRVASGRPGAALALGVALLRLAAGQPLLRLGQHRSSGLVPLVEVDLPLVEAAGLGLQRRQLGLRPVDPAARVLQGGGQPAQLGLGSGGPRAQRADLAGQPGQPLAAVGDRPDGGHERPLLHRVGRLGVGAPGDGVLQSPAVVGQLRPQLGLLGPHRSRLPVEVLGVAGRAGLLRQGGGQVPVPLGGQRRGAPQPLLERCQPVPGLLRPGEHRRLRRGGVGRARPRGPARRRARARPGPAGRAPAPRRAPRPQSGPQLQQVVGQQPQPGVAQVGLHLGRPPGDLGLPAERLELAAQLDGQVGQPVEVDLHRVELAERLLLALAVLEDAGRLLDEAAAVLRTGRQDGVELALADHDVQLAADAAVAHQLLHVDQPAPAAVDGVLRRPVAEHQAGDADLGVVDRQRAVGVVDRERHLGPPERRAAGRAGEDDVLHLAAAQRLGPLLAEHPGDGVDHVALAGAVRAHHAGDAGLEAQRRRRREGLEALQREALEVHLVLYPSPVRGPVVPAAGRREGTGGAGRSGAGWSWSGGGGVRRPAARLGEGGLLVERQQADVVLDVHRGDERVVGGGQPGQLGLEGTDPATQAAHLVDEAQVGATDMTEQGLGHG